ncbi:bifunctional 2-C-methyl-D-erythritol 4-phosphate cytidylyltransferase/2-C-methyl-D-erythritol 2,4-cyclodiphosphate synthase [Phenylobacterium sp.]|uniref:bifunctional 2-C-methyl-D-erythritol 4-phosphate cytidylyltransferase/2-C-methyl-D-erythritol 2,4-cyclodiphosphate synthase n=1 Tax=Phenylobacterium sp. TaxID=1871053 RepID=UPI002731101C|nr:bifunctional 2-C-methyl-D-erythritol 4-phosphate cytidylyltransferase/2-C-methyl-D-erythritol 2,4-cyclodiphosphate synthase [Phenylobacterium sp.]MDP1874789.1 bifunctional 2-C-methyl-D-erythritol 4-phosphate cytidylyltransferase/2-C-methyl-D-erythritol 2,4-cyclodiphosphate synthase [Phenylobacterium sp.]MDP3299819.1 bifunctional 2-C-methyl-D-erythritol 4-phosphate cytidylyltransferase/2-C-methyl-D-erythritol 2,4-cyclodiphosphate synthase [Phenylobacterium sp.]
MSFSAIVVAAGSGLRAGSGPPKAWRDLGGRAVARWSVEALAAAGASPVVVVVADDMRSEAQRALAGLSEVVFVAGGPTRAASVQAGLAALAQQGPDRPVLIHDAARPFVTRAHVQRLLGALTGADGAVLALPLADTLKRDEPNHLATPARDGLWRAQTPQAFELAVLRRGYGAWDFQTDPTDDAQVVTGAGGRVVLAPGDPMLFKLTYPEDFAMAEHLASGARQVRTGLGYDAHRWGPGDAVWLCGVRIDHDQTLVGHSDADAGLHALTDALLGALGAGDIGEHFPPTDPQWRGVSSDRFLAHAADLVRARGGQIVNVDVTLICERPKIRPHRDAMRARLAEILGLLEDQVSVKATTTEGMGFTGRQEGLAAQAIATIELPR